MKTAIDFETKLAAYSEALKNCDNLYEIMVASGYNKKLETEYTKACKIADKLRGPLNTALTRLAKDLY